MRADRLVATLLLIQARGRVTAAELAGELEVSVATARRDLEALSSSGVPVYPQPGRGGGWQLLGGARTDLSGLSAPETRALFLLVGPAASRSEQLSPEAKAALRKLVRALPQTFRADAEAAAGATLVDRSGWSERDRERPELLDRLQDAVVTRRRVRLTYAGPGREPSERLVEPWGLVDKDETWYLLAGVEQDGGTRGRRTFRVDRIAAAEVTADGFERPDDFTLAGAWAEVVGAVEERRSQTWATVLVDARFAYVLRDQFGRHCEVAEAGPDGRARVRVGAPTPLDLARHLAGWGTALLDVVEPPAVRAELARIGGELAARYADGTAGEGAGASSASASSISARGIPSR